MRNFLDKLYAVFQVHVEILGALRNIVFQLQQMNLFFSDARHTYIERKQLSTSYPEVVNTKPTEPPDTELENK